MIEAPDIERRNREKAYRERCRDDFAFYAKRCLKVVRDDGQLVPFELNQVQRYIHFRIEGQLKKRGYVRALVLKARKGGCSTYTEGRNYWRTTHRRGTQCLIMTHEDKSTTHLFRMAKTFHQHCPDEFRPQTMNSSSIELLFDTPQGTGLKSQYIIQTAGASGGRGLNPRLVHLSEYAYFGDRAMGVVGGVMEAIPSGEPAIFGTEVIIETTANGRGEPFHRAWMESKEQEADGKEPEYIRIFVPWFYDLRNWRTASEAEARDILCSLTEHEKWLLEQRDWEGRSVTVHQLNWRRWKIDNITPPIGMTKADFFRQEHPATVTEAFVFSGNQVFNQSYIDNQRNECYTPLYRGDLEFHTGKFIQRMTGNLLVWELPRRGQRYVIGADVAEGIEGGDYSCADVLILPTGRQVAHWHGTIDPDSWGDILYHLGYFYGSERPALIGVECNNHGHTTIARLQHLKYPLIYQRETLDGPTGRKVKKYGFLSTGNSKFKMIDTVNAELREGTSGIMCNPTLDEMETFVELRKNKSTSAYGVYGAQPGSHDDRVISYAIALQMLYTVPKAMKLRERKKGKKYVRKSLQEDFLKAAA